MKASIVAASLFYYLLISETKNLTKTRYFQHQLFYNPAS